MSDIPPETEPFFSIKRDLTQAELAELARERGALRKENSGGFARGDDTASSSSVRETPADIRPSPDERILEREQPFPGKHSEVFAHAIGLDADDEVLGAREETLVNAEVNDEGDVVPVYTGDNGPRFVDSSTTDEYPEPTVSINDGLTTGRMPVAKTYKDTRTFLPRGPGILAGIETDEGDVKPDYTGINGPINTAA